MSKTNAGNSSQSQQEGAARAIPGFEVAGDLAAEGAARMQGLVSELASLDQANTARLRAASDGFGKLLSDSLGYGVEMAAEWRRAAFEVARRGAEWMGSR